MTYEDDLARDRHRIRGHTNTQQKTPRHSLDSLVSDGGVGGRSVICPVGTLELCTRAMYLATHSREKQPIDIDLF